MLLQYLKEVPTINTRIAGKICREIFAGGLEMNAFCRDFSHNLLPFFLAALGGEFLRLPCISIVIVHEVEGAVEERAEDTDLDMLGVAM